ncbi:MAG: PriA 3primeBD protein, partial [Patescibacteria group bacterium]|nr:PriA 3primeBD protein [Patescibacteria group bacterium]
MFIVTVTPLDNGIFKDELSYFSKVSIETGALVLVPIRGREIISLVISVKPANTVKASLKKSDFSLKKISDIVHPGIFNPYILQSAKEASEYFGVNLGMTLKFMTPKIIIESLTSKKWPLPKNTPHKDAIGSAAVRPDYLALQDSTTERIGFYRSIIRESLARGQSVFVLVPTALTAEKLQPHLGKGIENHTKVLHSKIKDQTIITEWKAALESDQPTLYIATALFLSVPKSNLGLIIVENDSSDDYEPVSRPFIDPRRLAEFIAKIGHLKLLIGDTILRPDTIYRIENKEIIAAAPLQYRINNNIERQIIDMRQPPAEGEKESFNIFSPQVESLIREAEIK